MKFRVGLINRSSSMLKGIAFFVIMVLAAYLLVDTFPELPKERRKKLLIGTGRLLGVSLFILVIAVALTLIF